MNFDRYLNSFEFRQNSGPTFCHLVKLLFLECSCCVVEMYKMKTKPEEMGRMYLVKVFTQIYINM